MLAVVAAGMIFMIRHIVTLLKNRLAGKRACIVAVAITAIVFALLGIILGFVNAMIVYVHLVLIWLLADFVIFIIKKITHKNITPLISAIAAFVLTTAIMVVGAVNAYTVKRTEYNIKSEDAGTKQFKIVGFSDSHTGTTFGGEGFREYVDKMNEENADIAVIVGDFVDDETSYEDMTKACEELSRLKTKYGTYYVFGNHDSGYYAGGRGYGRAELTETLEKNGITVLEDETVRLTEYIYLCGRLDRSMRDRLSMEEITKDFTGNKCLIVLDHQPNDYEAEEKAGADIVISGHTHGGQFFPVNRAGEWIGANDKTYGHEKIGNTDFIVSSGIADWALKFKTGCISEYFVVNISD